MTNYTITERRNGRGFITFAKALSPLDAAHIKARDQYGGNAIAQHVTGDTYRAAIICRGGVVSPIGKAYYVNESYGG